MSIITVVSVPEGIAMASDSRLTGYKKYDNGMIDRYALTDNSQKLFLLSKAVVGISWCGTAIIDNKTIADFIRIFEISAIEDGDTALQVANKLHEYLKTRYLESDTNFYVAGYKDDEPFIFTVSSKFIKRINNNEKEEILYRAVWNGEYEAADKLFNGNNSQIQLNLGLMPLKDAIDFSEFIVDVVIKYQRFEDRVATCGGPIDILVITKDYAKFIRHKILNP